jgi:hypothetical protein
LAGPAFLLAQFAFRSQLRKDFLPVSLARLTPSRDRWQWLPGILVSIIAFLEQISANYAINGWISQSENKEKETGVIAGFSAFFSLICLD